MPRIGRRGLADVRVCARGEIDPLVDGKSGCVDTVVVAAGIPDREDGRLCDKMG
jgi:hypothetical protein